MLAVVAVAVLAAIWAATAIYEFQARQPGFPFSPVQPPRYIPGDIELFYIMRTVLSAVNITLLVVLIVTYASIYVKTRSEFTIGLLIFAIVFLLKDLTANPFVIGAFGFGLYGLGPFALLPDLFEFVALTVLLYLSIKY
jgi:type III secretory pathway component EscS